MRKRQRATEEVRIRLKQISRLLVAHNIPADGAAMMAWVHIAIFTAMAKGMSFPKFIGYVSQIWDLNEQHQKDVILGAVKDWAEQKHLELWDPKGPSH